MSAELEKKVDDGLESIRAPHSTSAKELVLSKINLLRDCTVADGLYYPFRRPADQTLKLLEMMEKKDPKTEGFLDILAGLYKENPARSDYDALAVAAAATLYVAETAYGSDKVFNQLFSEKGYIDFINNNVQQIKDIAAGRTNCPTFPQRTLPLADRLMDMSGKKIKLLEVGCSVGAIAGTILLQPNLFFNDKTILLPNSELDINRIKNFQGSIIDSYWGTDLQGDMGKYFNNKDNEGYFKCLLGPKQADERPVMEQTVETIKSNNWSNDPRFKTSQMDIVSFPEHKTEIQEFFTDADLSYVYSSYVYYQLPREARINFLKCAAETGSILAIQGPTLDECSDYTSGGWHNFYSEYEVQDIVGNNFILKETRYYDLGISTCGLSLKKIEPESRIITLSFD